MNGGGWDGFFVVMAGLMGAVGFILITNGYWLLGAAVLVLCAVAAFGDRHG